MLLLSYIGVCLINPGHTPDDKIWKIKVDDTASTEQQLLEISIEIEKREELLASNRNIISEDNLNESRTTSGSLFYILNFLIYQRLIPLLAIILSIIPLMRDLMITQLDIA